MIRRVLIGVLVTGSLALALVGLASLWAEVGRAGPFGDRSYGLIEIDGGNLHVVYARRGERTEPRSSVRYGKTPLEEVAIREKPMPDKYINAEGNFVTKAFVNFLKPLVGELPEYVTLKARKVVR